MNQLAFTVIYVLIATLLVACNQNTTTANTSSADSSDSPANPANNEAASELVGCYSVEKGVPAQIYISQNQGRFFMQMQEKTGGWDTPEPLDQVDISQAWTYFANNKLNLKQADMQAVLVRPDKVMALGATTPALTGLNPMMDSRFVIYIVGAVNTVYQVECGS